MRVVDVALRVYCVHPISGLSFKQVVDYYSRVVPALEHLGYNVFHPMIGKMYLQTEGSIKSEGYDNPLSKDHAIMGRDHWMVRTSDIIYANLLGAKIVSIGSCMELAWAYDRGKHTVVVMEKNNPHRHAFVLEAAHIVFETEKEALDYLEKLAKGTI